MALSLKSRVKERVFVWETVLSDQSVFHGLKSLWTWYTCDSVVAIQVSSLPLGEIEGGVESECLVDRHLNTNSYVSLFFTLAPPTFGSCCSYVVVKW